MKHDPANPKWKDRDRVILSKGHCCPALYSVMAECGYCPKDQLNTLRKMGSIYQGHPDVRFLPALEASTGSLGEGLSLGIGMALAAKLNGSPSRTYVILGDGEIQEGQIWEAAMFAFVKKVDNLVAIVDYNKIQLDGFVKDIMDLEPLAAKWQAFGWHTVEINGHDIAALQHAFFDAATRDRPAHLHSGPHHQREGRVVHGEQSQVSRNGADRGRSRASASGAGHDREKRNTN
jgi:transketolase